MFVLLVDVLENDQNEIPNGDCIII